MSQHDARDALDASDADLIEQQRDLTGRADDDEHPETEPDGTAEPLDAEPADLAEQRAEVDLEEDS